MAKHVSKVPKSVKMRPEQHKSVKIYPKFAKVSQNEKNARSAQKYHSMLQVQNQRKWPMLKVLKGSFLGTPLWEWEWVADQLQHIVVQYF